MASEQLPDRSLNADLAKEGGGEALFLRATLGSRSFVVLAAMLAAVLGLLVLTSAGGWPVAARIGVGSALVLCGCVLPWRGIWRCGVRLTATCVRFVGVGVPVEVPWSRVLAVRFTWAQFGHALVIVPTPGSGERVRGSYALGLVDSVFASRFIREHVPDVVVDPVEPWQDRLGQWHSELHEFDPLESIRSIRRAAVGDLTIGVVVVSGGFRAVTLDREGRVVRASPTATHIQTATTAAMAQILIARDEEH